MLIKFNLNGIDYEMDVRGDRRLLDFLRDDMHLTGAKEGCGEGECGACTVIVDRLAVNSCLIFVGQMDGAEIITIEGLANDGKLDVLQEAFVRNSAIQCGYCTPGMVMSAKALLMRNPCPTDMEIREAISGNICRCSGYTQIVAAVKDAAKQMRNAAITNCSYSD
ncbi:MAG: (2Fe-2S)-binding protein [Oscillospiraceae bacterium]|nr:(2Fe-2S)-binding protein [Oscillospiraceae bacterium]